MPLISWNQALAAEREMPYYRELMSRIDAARESGVCIYPPQSQLFHALEATPLDQVKVVILGQDPYHGARQAHGLAFSVARGTPVPPSLQNIYKELALDNADFRIPHHGHLQAWAAQGVLLLNTVLSVEAGKAHSHARWGWERFTDTLISTLNEQRHGLVFMLWGAHAQKKGAIIDADKHCILHAPHPSPLSVYRGFYGCKHFSTANAHLRKLGLAEIDWQV